MEIGLVYFDIFGHEIFDNMQMSIADGLLHSMVPIFMDMNSISFSLFDFL